MSAILTVELKTGRDLLIVSLCDTICASRHPWGHPILTGILMIIDPDDGELQYGLAIMEMVVKRTSSVLKARAVRRYGAGFLCGQGLVGSLREGHVTFVTWSVSSGGYSQPEAAISADSSARASKFSRKRMVAALHVAR